MDTREKEAESSPRTFWSFAREFSSFRRQWAACESDADPDTVLPVYSGDRAIRLSRQSPPDARARGFRWSEGGQLLVIMRPRRLMGTSRRPPIGWPQREPGVRRPRADVRSAGTASPVPSYISSGVCPRNAECGSTRLCSWT